jgi:hypothetical protein
MAGRQVAERGDSATPRGRRSPLRREDIDLRIREGKEKRDAG